MVLGVKQDNLYGLEVNMKNLEIMRSMIEQELNGVMSGMTNDSDGATFITTHYNAEWLATCDVWTHRNITSCEVYMFDCDRKIHVFTDEVVRVNQHIEDMTFLEIACFVQHLTEEYKKMELFYRRNLKLELSV